MVQLHAVPVGSSRRDELEFIVELTREMLDQARAGSWDAVTEIQQQRKALIYDFFGDKPKRDEADFIRRGIERILSMDKEVMALGDEAKNGFTEKLATLSANRRATHAYLDNQ